MKKILQMQEQIFAFIKQVLINFWNRGMQNFIVFMVFFVVVFIIVITFKNT